MDQYNRNEQTGNGAFTGETNGKDHEYRERPGRVRRSVNDSAEMRSSLSRGGQVNQPNSSQVQYQSSAAAPYGGQYANTSPARNRQGSLVSPGGISNGYGTAQTANSPNGYGAVQAASNPNGYGSPQSAGSLNGYGGPQTAGNLNAYRAQQGAINPNGYTAAQQSSASANGYAGQQYAGGQYSGGQPRSAGQQALNGQYAQTNQFASNRNVRVRAEHSRLHRQAADRQIRQRISLRPADRGMLRQTRHILVIGTGAREPASPEYVTGGFLPSFHCPRQISQRLREKGRVK